MNKDRFSILTPPVFTHRQPHIGHTLAFTLPDVAARYYSLQGFEVKSPRSYNALGKPMDENVELINLKTRSFHHAARRQARSQIETISAVQDRLGVLDEHTFFDFGKAEQAVAQKAVSQLHEKGWLSVSDGHLFLDIGRMQSEPGYSEYVQKIDVFPSARRRDFNALLFGSKQDALEHKQITDMRRFATPIPSHMDHLVNTGVAISPHFNLATQAMALDEASAHHDLLVSGLGVVARWPLLMIAVNYASGKDIPFSHIYIHNYILGADGRRMHFANQNLVQLHDLFDKREGHLQDTVRFYAIMSTVEGKATESRHNPDYLVQGDRLIATLSTTGKALASRLEVQKLKWEEGEFTPEYQIDMQSYHFKKVLIKIESEAKQLRGAVVQAIKDSQSTGLNTLDELAVHYQQILRQMEPFMPRAVNHIKNTFFITQ